MVRVDFMMIMFLSVLKLHAAWFESEDPLKDRWWGPRVVLFVQVCWPAPWMSMLISTGAKPTKTRSVLSYDFVWIAVEPVFAWLSRRDHRMTTGVCVFTGMPIRRAVTAERDSTRLARPQMDPVAADLYALFALALVRLLDRFNRNCIQMRTTPGIHDRLA